MQAITINHGNTSRKLNEFFSDFLTQKNHLMHKWSNLIFFLKNTKNITLMNTTIIFLDNNFVQFLKKYGNKA